jgi:hypothetical protein
VCLSKIVCFCGALNNTTTKICSKESISDAEAQNWMKARYDEVYKYTEDKGVFEYDDRKIN